MYRLRSLDTICRVAVIGVVALALLVLTGGWLLGITRLQSVLPGLPTMKFNTALCFLLLGLGLWRYMTIAGRSPAAMALAGGVILIASFAILDYSGYPAPNIGQRIAPDTATPPDQFPGRMSEGTAVNFLLLGVALLLLNTKSGRRYSPFPAFIAAAIAHLALLIYIYDANQLGELLFLRSMAVHTAVSFLALSLSVILMRPESNLVTLLTSPGGDVMRRLIPIAVIGPSLLGYVINLGSYQNATALALFAIFSSILLCAFVWWSANSIQETDARRENAEGNLHRINRAYRILSHGNQAMIRATDEHDLLKTVCDGIVEEGVYDKALLLVGEVDANNQLRADYTVQRSTFATTDQTINPEDELAPYLRQTILKNKPFYAAGSDCSWITLPIKTDEQTYGALCVCGGNEGFDQQEIDLFEEMADDLGFGIQTLRERKAKAKAEADVRYQADLIDKVLDAVIATDENFVIKSWNQSAEALYGWRAEEAIGRRFGDLVKTSYPNNDGQEVLEAFKEQGFWLGEVIQQRRDGTQINILSASAILTGPGGEMLGAVAVNRDMTDYKRMEREKAQFEAQFRVIFDGALDAIMVIDGDTGEILRANDTFQRVFDHQPEQLIGKHFSKLYTDNHDSEEVIDRLQAYGEVFVSQEFIGADGVIHLMDVTANIIPWHEGSAVLVTLRDVTERRRVEKKLMEAEVIRANLEKERELLQLKERFIATVSHEFRTPLTVIMSSAQLLERYQDKNIPKERSQKHFNNINGQVKFMLDMLEDVLAFTKLRSDNFTLTPVQVDLAAFCHEIFDQAQINKADNLIFEFAYHGSLKEAMIDETLLRRILSNLLSNARKYSPDGGIIRFKVTRSMDHLTFVISDEGIGIPEKDQKRLFEPFQRASNAKDIRGTGLGTAIVGESVDVYGGKISFQSTEGVGTTFTVQLPLLETPQLAKTVN